MSGHDFFYIIFYPIFFVGDVSSLPVWLIVKTVNHSCFKKKHSEHDRYWANRRFCVVSGTPKARFSLFFPNNGLHAPKKKITGISTLCDLLKQWEPLGMCHD